MANVQLKVNVINQLQLLRRSSFKDKVSFIDEDVQNAQRAKATEVRITTDRYSGKRVTIENNGEVLKDPQMLFSIADTGWDAETVENENPFGMGFFSNITVSDEIEIHSGNMRILFNVDEMISSGNTDVSVEHIEEYYDGFKLILNNFKYDEVQTWDIEERAKLLGRYVHDLDIIYNDELQEKKNITETDGSVFAKAIEEHNFRGWLALDNQFTSQVNVFYKGRLIKKIEDLWYLKGDVHISDSALNLTAPDRKDIIKDNKLSLFLQDLKDHASIICEDAALLGEQTNINKYADAIAWYCDTDKIKDTMRFMVFRGSDQERLKYLNSIMFASQLSGRHMSFIQAEAYLKEESSRQSEEHFEEVSFEKGPDNKAQTRTHFESSGYSSSYHEPIIAEKEKVEHDGSTIFELDRPKFWVEYSELNTYEGQIAIIKQYDLYLIMARNKLEKAVLKNLDENGTITHISKLEEKIAIRSTLSNTTLNVIEQRAMMLFDMISRMAGFNRNICAIGDLKVSRCLEITDLNIRDEKIEKDVIAIYNKEADKIYVDRSAIMQNKLIRSTNPKLCLSDYQFIMANITLLSHEINMMKDTGCYEDVLNGLLKTLSEV